MRKNKLRYGKIVADSYYPSEKNNGAVIIFCAGIPGKSNYLELAKRYVDEGFTFIHPKYIGSWESYGNFSITKCKETIISFVGGLKAGKIKTVFNNSFDVSPKKIFLVGHSFGGSIALSTGAELDIDGIVALAPVVDYSVHAKDPNIREENLSGLFDFMKFGFENTYRKMNKMEWDNFCETGIDVNPVDYVDNLRNKRILLIHGKNDNSVSCNRTKEFYEKLNSEKSVYKETEDNHSRIKENSIPAVISWIWKMENEGNS
ncbi:prolyl oligopeptidase family serine peptidase [Candidatus Woesearchaeota archaeon]|jgi:esterase/lipase|nr:prolyl oligopeptidase family serine peptidase [Candidatus Woesearchaeota archaeon]MBT4321994.1 prolyl oligopeptidase family serine peptidase [Candidatus Woesearchaeota archaeon]MBT4630740.1 prolyl oligopeptidase family serine peptidase [Candidatus Woesearchaeota archaeon]